MSASRRARAGSPHRRPAGTVSCRNRGKTPSKLGLANWVRVGAAVLAAAVVLVCGHGSSQAAHRTVDGSGNNLAEPGWGAAGQNLTRIGAPAYGDAVSSPAHLGFANPRVISNTVFAQTGATIDPRGLSAWVWSWGQFIDHDLSLTPKQSAPAESMNIPIPQNDPVFQPGNQILFTRSAFAPATGTSPANPRQQVNAITSWLDASMVYGSDEERSRWLRSGIGGKLKVTEHPLYGNLLPTQGGDLDAPRMDMDQVLGPDTFVAGDSRANEQPGLTSLHTLFVREHNRVAALIDATHPDLPVDPAARDEEIYQRARKILGAEIQSITYNAFLPAVGVTLPPYAGYDARVNPAIAVEFSTAGFRIGHSMISSQLMRLEENRAPSPQGHLSLGEAFFDPSRITLEGGIEPILRGLGYQDLQDIDAKVIDELRNQLFTGPSPPSPVANASDLVSLNIQRGRDHGLPDYNSAREAYGLPRFRDFGDITSDPALRDALAMVYADVDHMDLWAGLLSEDHLDGKSLGSLANAIWTDQFTRLRDGDRFWYKNDPDLLVWAAPWLGLQYPNALSWLEDLRLCDIITANTRVAWMQENVFFASSGPALRPIPEPSTWLTFGGGTTGLAGLLRHARRRRAQSSR